ncbi:hypothetical protein SAMN06265377_0471 [Flagellimonas pacifica]|uniref:Uncharacterized protein n=1 Tax=Flagellimonas pacifica TaxID=1247520 RepID=A0A285MH54_9FLAO|nr:hypothetical protein SAMN06265377_0471 [Allomuricauda parva]
MAQYAPDLLSKIQVNLPMNLLNKYLHNQQKSLHSKYTGILDRLLCFKEIFILSSPDCASGNNSRIFIRIVH